MPTLACLSEPWANDDFAPCFREIVINGIIPVLILKCSAILIVKAIVRHAKASLPQHEPLLATHASGSKQYGSVSTSDGVTEALEEDEEPLARWSLYNITRFTASALQCMLISCAITCIVHHTYILDPVVEPNESVVLAAYYMQTIYWIYALVLSIAIVLSENKHIADVMCAHLNTIYAFALLTGFVSLRSFYISNEQDISNTGYKITLASSFTTLMLLFIIIHEERHKPLYVESSPGRVRSPEYRASLYSKFMFSYVEPMLKKGYNTTLDDKDLHELPKVNQAKYTLANFREHRHTKLMLSLSKTFQQPLLAQFAYSLVWSLSMFYLPFALNKIIKFIEQPGSGPGLTPYLYVISMFVASTIQSLSHQQDLYIGRTLGLRIQSIVVGEVYGKALRRRQQGNESEGDEEQHAESQSNINNLLSLDASKLADIPVFGPFFVSYIMQMAICTYGLYQLLGSAAIYGVVIMVLSQPLFYKLNSKFETLQRTVMGFTDKRMKVMNELLNAIRIVKFFAWEDEFRKRICEAREVELKATRSRLLMLVALDTTWFFITVTIMATVFYVYTISHMLTASTAFTALALFNIFKTALEDLPFVITVLVQGYVSLRRVENFLQEEEVQPLQSTVSWDTNTAVGFVNNASFSWDPRSTKPILRNLNLSFPLRRLSLVCGPTGCGKSTLLASLLGETYCHGGSAVLPRKHFSLSLGTGGAVSGVAYVAQTAWLQNCSIRDNILFGLPYSKERYEKVISMTALLPDLEILQHGDQTEVGERGVTLSGGQKQRVAIARAVYSQADTIILDDCLSAVDAHTAKHLYEHCLTGELLRERTVILVTHHVNLCIKGADYVVALKDGEVTAAGKPQDVIAAGVLGEEVTRYDDEKNLAMTSTIAEVSETKQKNSTKSKDKGGKLTNEEERAEGGVSWKVYAAYFYASGGFPFWAAVIVLYGASQAAIVGQDIWIKVWSSASSENTNSSNVEATTTGASYHSLQSVYNGGNVLLTPVYHVPDCLSSYTSATVSYYLGVYILIGILALIMASLRLVVLFIGSLRASRYMHTQLLDAILSAKVRFFDITPIGQIINRFSSDLQTIDQDLSPTLSGLLYALVAAPFVVILIAYAIPLFLVPGALIAVLFWSVSAYYLNTSRDLKRLNSVSRSPIYVQFHESVSGVTTIRAFGCQRRFIEENYETIDNNNRPFLCMWNVNRWLHCRLDILGSFVGLVTGVGLLLSSSSIDAGLAGLVLSNSLLFTHMVIIAVRYYSMYELDCNSVERVQEYLDIEKESPAHTAATSPRSSWPETGSVKVDQLVIQYAPETPPVLHGISFETHPREKVGIVGRTGSGKSTLALSLFRFMEATSGSIKIDGVDISQLGLHDLRSRLTIIPQDPVLFSGTLRSNLDPFGEFTDADLYIALRRSHLIHEGDDITLDSPVAENGSNWSQGQRQLIALARALVKKSSLIVLDEATSSVDFHTDQQIQETIRSELFADSSLLCIAHRLRTVADYDRILVLEQGKVVDFDTPYALITREDSLFHQMCERSGEFPELLAIAQRKANSLGP
ncbi:P-loop containing nucleoside triphosphate hydrolase protein [Fennellomyces sp. T-0311]|nr:P-loop containing nucleoside triphosphate hydrolase protein [Fennellomyces sp. T-0311]